MNFGVSENGLEELRSTDKKPNDSDKEVAIKKEKKGRRKIKIEFIEDKSRRNTTFSKRRFGIMKKACELATLTGTQILLLVASETGHVYTFATPKLQPLITKPEGRNMIQMCLSGQELSNTPSLTLNSSNSYNMSLNNNDNNFQSLYPEYAEDRGVRHMDPVGLSPYGQKQLKNKISHNSLNSTIQVLNPKLPMQDGQCSIRPAYNSFYRTQFPVNQNPGVPMFPHIINPQNGGGYASYIHLLPTQRVSVDEIKRHSETNNL